MRDNAHDILFDFDEDNDIFYYPIIIIILHRSKRLLRRCSEINNVDKCVLLACILVLSI